MQTPDEQTPAGADDARGEEALDEIRREKGRKWAESGFLPYGNETPGITPLRAITDAHPAEHDAAWFEAHAEELAGQTVRVAGRVLLSRRQGKLRFLKIRDGRAGTPENAPASLQLFVSLADVGEEAWKLFDLVDLGDIVEASGTVMRTRLGELSLRVKTFRPLTKALRAPAKWNTVDDVEIRYRQRYVDLIENHEAVASVFRARTLMIRELRAWLDARDFLEVETPLLQSVRGGATAKPFTTHHNALDMDLYLRIAPELFLKRLLVGGFDRVYEIGRNFRNEGISTRHNPEFTMLEFYQAYATCDDLMDQTEQLLRDVDASLRRAFPVFSEGRSFTFDEPWARVTMRDAVRASLRKRWPALCGVWSFLDDGAPGNWVEMRDHVLHSPGLAVSADERAYVAKCASAGELLFALYEIFAESHLVEDYRSADGSRSLPVFVTDHPFDTSPLARKMDATRQRARHGEIELDLVDRFELFIDGRELCNAFSELNDPDDQAARFRAQLENRARGNEEAMDYDADYIRALAYGMPPAAGFGMGVDRLAMLLTGARSIRDVILFPLLRPEQARG